MVKISYTGMASSLTSSLYILDGVKVMLLSRMTCTAMTVVSDRLMEDRLVQFTLKKYGLLTGRISSTNTSPVTLSILKNLESSEESSIEYVTAAFSPTSSSMHNTLDTKVSTSVVPLSVVI